MSIPKVIQSVGPFHYDGLTTCYLCGLYHAHVRSYWSIYCPKKNKTIVFDCDVITIKDGDCSPEAWKLASLDRASSTCVTCRHEGDDCPHRAWKGNDPKHTTCQFWNQDIPKEDS